MTLAVDWDIKHQIKQTQVPGRVVPSETCLATDASLTVDPILFTEFDYEISTVILLPSSESFKKGCCQLQAKVCARSIG